MEQAVKASGLEYVIFRPSFIFGHDGGLLHGLASGSLFAGDARGSGGRAPADLGRGRAAFFARSSTIGVNGNRTLELGGPDQVTWPSSYAASSAPSASGARADAGQALRAGRRRRAGATASPRRAWPVEMLEGATTSRDVGPAVETFGVQPIGLDEQLAARASLTRD